MNRGQLVQALTYVAAIAAAAGVCFALRGQHPIVIAAVADLVATVVVFGFSRAFDNVSLYDPYWSVGPMVIVLYWALGPWAEGADPTRTAIGVGLVFLWGGRLTFNFFRRWRGLDDEDWRYVDLRKKHDRGFWLVSFFGLHTLPTVLVFLGCLPLFPIVTSSQPVAAVETVGIGIAALGLGIEWMADRQLNAFIRTKPEPTALLATGLWRLARHPNYFGEVVFWWGLFVFGAAVDRAYWWTGVGALGIYLLIRFISVPMIDERMRARRPSYAEHEQSTPAMVPWPRRG